MLVRYVCVCVRFSFLRYFFPTLFSGINDTRSTFLNMYIRVYAGAPFFLFLLPEWWIIRNFVFHRILCVCVCVYGIILESMNKYSSLWIANLWSVLITSIEFITSQSATQFCQNQALTGNNRFSTIKSPKNIIANGVEHKNGPKKKKRSNE